MEVGESGDVSIVEEGGERDGWERWEILTKWYGERRKLVARKVRLELCSKDGVGFHDGWSMPRFETVTYRVLGFT